LTLVPEQAGPVLNYFVDPYLEINGKPSNNVVKKCFWNENIDDGDLYFRNRNSQPGA
jgi:hypothetical protein